MKKPLYSLAIVVLITFALSSCSSAWKTIDSGHVANVELEPIKPDRYIILGEVEGYGSASGLGSGNGGLLSRGVPRLVRAQQSAEYQAISKVEGADMLLAPRYENETFSFLFFFSTAKVKVKAKAVRIKSSDEK